MTEVLREPGRVANGRLMPFICRNTYIVNPLIAEKPYRALQTTIYKDEISLKYEGLKIVKIR